MRADPRTLPLSFANVGANPSIFRRTWRAVVIGFFACIDAYAAAAEYERIARLSDAELKRREMTRADLHRHVFERLSR
jgi:hypothetical protein